MSPKMVPLVPVRCLAILSSRYFVQRIDHVKVFNNNVTVCVWLIGRGSNATNKTETYNQDLEGRVDADIVFTLVNVMLVLCLFCRLPTKPASLVQQICDTK